MADTPDYQHMALKEREKKRKKEIAINCIEQMFRSDVLLKLNTIFRQFNQGQMKSCEGFPNL